jgi:hypothetical protein
MKTSILAAAFIAAISTPAFAQQSATGGSAGTASTGGTSASTLGVGATSTDGQQTSSAMGMGASAAGGDRQKTRAAVHGNRNLNGQAMARAQDGGTFSRSHTVCHEKAGSDVSCKTKSMSHEPGQAPVKSRSSTP